MVTKEESVGSLTDPVPAGEFGLCDALRAGVRTVGTYHYESCVIMIRGISRLLAKILGALVLLSAHACPVKREGCAE
jgi:hypothetical protein